MNQMSLQPELNTVNELSRFKGFYCLVGVVAKVSKSQTPYWIIKLCDAFDTVDVVAFSLEDELQKMKNFGFIHLEAKRTRCNQTYYWQADFIYAVDEVHIRY